MDIEQVKLQVLSILRKNYLALGLGFLGLIFFAYGLIGLSSSQQSASNVIFDSETSASQSSQALMISVDIEGAVVNPGVYKLPQDSRTQDALIAAGGLSASADREWVSKNLNLALKVSDADKIYIPIAGENAGQQTLGTATNVSGLINVNKASEKELDSLPGVGAVTAGKIINGRPYGALDDLLKKKIVTSKVFSQIKDKITLY